MGYETRSPAPHPLKTVRNRVLFPGTTRRPPGTCSRTSSKPEDESSGNALDTTQLVPNCYNEGKIKPALSRFRLTGYDPSPRTPEGLLASPCLVHRITERRNGPRHTNV